MLVPPELDTALKGGSHESGVEGENPLPDLLATLLLMQPRIWLAFWAEDTHWQVMLSFLSTNTPKSSTGLLSIHSSPSLY